MNLTPAMNQPHHDFSEWEGFRKGDWNQSVDVRDFILRNYTLYEGDADFLSGPTDRTQRIWNQVLDLMKQENAKDGPLDFDADTPSSITSHRPGYIDKANELIVGLQTDAPLKRSIMPLGGLNMVKRSCEVYGKTLNPHVDEIFGQFRKTHNQGVFDVYTQDIFACRKAGIITGLPDAYGRGRIIGDYRRVALYGIDWLIATKIQEKAGLNPGDIDSPAIRLLEELSDQIRALAQMKEMAAEYGYDISKPARTAREAVQWTYFAYLASVKSQNGAAMSLGRVSTFLDIFIERDLHKGTLTEGAAQELIDDLVIKLRMIRFLRTPEYDALFSGDPAWVTEALAGMTEDGKPLVTKTSFRLLHTLYNLGPSPEPNLTVLWSTHLPLHFKQFCAQVSIDTSSIQYENDDLMRPYWGDDYSIACCVSAMRTGKQMQFFGARCNLAKGLLYAINGGRDEVSGVQVGPAMEVMQDEVLDYDRVMARYDFYLNWVAATYIKALNIIHYMHDRYCYESALMALHDRDILRTMACGIAGLSIVADALSAIKYATVRPIRNEEGIVVDYQTEGEFPTFGNNDSRVDEIASGLVSKFMNCLRQHRTYRGSTPTQSVLTITSNVVYGKATGATPDGRKAGQPFAPGANPMHGRDTKGALASLLSVAKLPYEDAQDGISYTLSIVPAALGKDAPTKVNNLVALLDGYFTATGQHINVNVLNRDTLLDAMEHPEQYPQLTVRVSGYAVNFVKLTREQQQDIITRTFHGSM